MRMSLPSEADDGADFVMQVRIFVSVNFSWHIGAHLVDFADQLQSEFNPLGEEGPYAVAAGFQCVAEV
jgi:hypothetical protein